MLFHSSVWVEMETKVVPNTCTKSYHGCVKVLSKGFERKLVLEVGYKDRVVSLFFRKLFNENVFLFWHLVLNFSFLLICCISSFSSLFLRPLTSWKSRRVGQRRPIRIGGKIKDIYLEGTGPVEWILSWITAVMVNYIVKISTL